MNGKYLVMILVIIAALLAVSVYILTQYFNQSKPELQSLDNLSLELDSALQTSDSLSDLLDSN